MDVVERLESLADCESALYRLLQATLRHEAQVAARDKEIAAIQHRFGPSIEKSSQQIATLEAQIEAFYVEHREEIELDGKKSVQLGSGVIGMRAPGNPALVPVSDKWTWEKIADKVRELFGAKKYFHPPKPPGLDKVKLKKSLTGEQLHECGLKLDTAEKFYYDLNRLPVADQQTASSAA